MSRTKDNYEKHREELVAQLSRGAVCYDCLAKPLCKKMCEDKSIDPSTSPAPCQEAWNEWVAKTE